MKNNPEPPMESPAYVDEEEELQPQSPTLIMDPANNGGGIASLGYLRARRQLPGPYPSIIPQGGIGMPVGGGLNQDYGDGGLYLLVSICKNTPSFTYFLSPF